MGGTDDLINSVVEAVCCCCGVPMIISMQLCFFTIRSIVLDPPKRLFGFRAYRVAQKSKLSYSVDISTKG